MSGGDVDSDELYRPLYVTDLLVNALNQDPYRPLLQLLGGPMLTVGQVRDETSRYVQALASLGVGRETRVALLSANRPEVLHVSHAVQILAGIIAPLHPLGSAADHRYQIQDGGIEILVFEGERYSERAAELARSAPGLRLASLGPSPIADDLGTLAAGLSPQPLVAPRVEGTDVMRLGYSGGTTGKPKSLTTSQRVCTAMFNVMMAEWEWPNPPRVLTCAPLSHSGAALALPVASERRHHARPAGLRAGGGDAGDPGAPDQLHPRRAHHDLRAPRPSAIRGIRSLEPGDGLLRRLVDLAGAAEGGDRAHRPGVLTVLRPSRGADGDYSAAQSPSTMSTTCAAWQAAGGRHLGPMWRCSMQRTAPCRMAEPGEICVRGPLVFDGYRNNPELNAATFRGGWHHTGDVAVRDPGGFLRIVDRTKDMIVSGGFNIYPREIEDILSEHPAVAQAAVIGMPHPKWGEAVTAVVVLRPGLDVAPEALDRHGRRTEGLVPGAEDV